LVKDISAFVSLNSWQGEMASVFAPTSRRFGWAAGSSNINRYARHRTGAANHDVTFLRKIDDFTVMLYVSGVETADTDFAEAVAARLGWLQAAVLGKDQQARLGAGPRYG
jgi:hypothetical protein